MHFEPLLCMPAAWTAVSPFFAVHMFEGRVSVAEMDRMQSVGDRWTAQHPGKRVEMVLIFPSDTRMTQEERARMARLIKHGEARRTASATVILAEGLLGSMQRSMLTGMMMLAPAPHPAKVFGSIADAVIWLEPHLHAASGSAVQLDALTSSLHAYVAQFRARTERPTLQMG